MFPGGDRPAYPVRVMTPNRPRTTGLAAAVVSSLLLLVAAACGSDPVAPTTTAPAGYTVMSSAKEGYALAVPSDWTPIALNNNPAVFDKTANSLRLANPKLASIMQKARLIGQSGGLFMAVTPDGAGDVNLTVDKPKEKNLDEIVANTITGLKGLEATDIAQEPATVAGQPGIKLTFKIPNDTDAGRVVNNAVQYHLLQNKKAYILTATAVPADVANNVVRTLRIR